MVKNNRQRSFKNIVKDSEGEIKISLLFINLNNAGILKKSLESLLPLSLQSELIVVDSGSKDGSQEILKQFFKKYQPQNQIKIFGSQGINPLSVNEARLFGLKRVKGSIVVFGDTDCIYPKKWVDFVIEDFEKNKNVVLVFGPRLPDNGKGLGALIRRVEGYQSRKYLCRRTKIFSNKSEKIFYVAGSNFAVKRKNLEDIGSFNPIFTGLSFEDVDLEERLLKDGFSLLFDPRLLIGHYHNLSYFGLLKKTIKSGKGFICLSLNHNKQIFIGKYSLFWDVMPLVSFIWLIFFPLNALSLLLAILFFYSIIFYKVFHRRLILKLFFVVLCIAPLIAIKDIVRASALVIEYFKIKFSVR